jgi:5-methylcytosine-specific restriction protein B
LIIDEINRANLSRVFGELMYLMEYRDQAITLAGGAEFIIPENVRILGTMNTADRSIALVDHALRRRFAFLELFPNFEILRQYHDKTGCNVDGLIQILEQLNKNIENSNYSLGISYFMRKDLPVHLEDIWKTEIEPYLHEYFFDKPQRAALFSWESIKDKIAL